MAHELSEDSVKFIVVDTGSGIKKKERHKLFKEFGKGIDSNGLNNQGTGLGLNLC